MGIRTYLINLTKIISDPAARAAVLPGLARFATILVAAAAAAALAVTVTRQDARPPVTLAVGSVQGGGLVSGTVAGAGVPSAPAIEFRDARPIWSPAGTSEAPLASRPVGAASTAVVQNNAVAATVPAAPVAVAGVTAAVAVQPPPSSIVPLVPSKLPSLSVPTGPPRVVAALGVSPTGPGGQASPLQAISMAKPALPRADAASCGAPDIVVTPQDGGLMGIAMASKCRAGESVSILYGTATIVARLDDAGVGAATLDLIFGGALSATVVFADGTRRVLPVVAHDLDRISKVALVWHAPVNLDLHVFEYAAQYGAPGHVWADAASSFAVAAEQGAAEGRGHGFMSSRADGTAAGDQIEVYTFVHVGKQAPGSVTMALDFASRGALPTGETCGKGAYAKLDYEFQVLGPRGQTNGGRGSIRPVDCDVAIAPATRFQQAGLPTLRFR